ncbi:MAG: CPBP family intramembrane glutamic endopeptidase [Gemmatimonadaceae bacterium]
MPERASHPFDLLLARHLFAAGLAMAMAVRLALHLLGPGDRADRFPVAFLGALTLVLVILAVARRAGVQWRRVFGPGLTRASLPLLASAVPVNILVILMLISGGSFLIYLPLSYVMPEFVERWLLSVPAGYLVKSPEQLARLVVLAVVIAPVVEEVLFRGLLMQRWARRWGTLNGVLVSSALFAFGHNEWVGHFVSGVLFSVLYLHTRQLWVPIAAHALNNFIAIVPLGLYELNHPPKATSMTLVQLEAEIPSAVLKLALGIALLAMYVHLYWPADRLRAALTGPLPYDVNAPV